MTFALTHFFHAHTHALALWTAGAQKRVTPGAIVSLELRLGGNIFPFSAGRSLQLIGNVANANDVRLSLNKSETEALGFGVYFVRRSDAKRWEITVGDAAAAEAGEEISIKSLPCGVRCTAAERHLHPMVCARPGWQGATLHMVLVSHAADAQ